MFRYRGSTTIIFDHVSSTDHASAKALLEKVSNSLFFQIDLEYDFTLKLQNHRHRNFNIPRFSKKTKELLNKGLEVSNPKYEYDPESISLYWYAKESGNMPIFQFLAYYQSIEFYFPVYFSYDLKQRIQGLIKDPRFNPNRDADISRIISISNASGYGNRSSEKEQFKATIQACTNNSELYSFFKEDEKRFEFYAEDKGKGLSSEKIAVKNEKTDFVLAVCARIYEIRCRIVHSKASGNDFEVLLPYSKEVRILNYDIELIEFISRKVLIHSSRPLNI